MTPQERRDTKILNGSRRARIAKGAGVSVTDVNQLIERFAEMQKVMRQMGSGMGLPGLPGGSKKARGRAPQPVARGRKSRSGNPAKRAAQDAALAGGPAGGTSLAGMDPAALDPSLLAGFDPSKLDVTDLPPAFRKMMG
jgi:signal recognition particle subunit SRP54